MSARRLLLFSALVSLATPAARAYAQGEAISPAPINQMRYVPGQITVEPRLTIGSLSSETQGAPSTFVFGLGGNVTWALDEKWFLSGGAAWLTGSGGGTKTNLYTLLAGGGRHLLGAPEDWYTIVGWAGVLLLGGGASATNDFGSTEELSIFGGGLGAALQAEVEAARWISFVPNVQLIHAFLGADQLVDGTVVSSGSANATSLTPGLDIWVYPFSSSTSRISVGAIVNVLRGSGGFVLSFGYAFTFGGAPPAPATAPPPEPEGPPKPAKP